VANRSIGQAKMVSELRENVIVPAHDAEDLRIGL